MNLRDLPPGSAVLVPAEWLAEVVGEEQEPEVISTEQASEIWPAYSAETWRRWAADGLIGGAWQDIAGLIPPHIRTRRSPVAAILAPAVCRS